MNHHDWVRQKRLREAAERRAKESSDRKAYLANLTSAERKKAESEERKSLHKALSRSEGRRFKLDKKGRDIQCEHCRGNAFVWNKSAKKWEYCAACGGTGSVLE